MSRFSEQSLEAVTLILENWAKGELSKALSNLSSQKLNSSGDLRKSLVYKIANEGGTKARIVIQYLYYGTILDRNFIYSKGKGVSTSRIEDWLNEGGMSKMGGYRGDEKDPQRQTREVAWAIRRSWEKKGGRQGRPWNFRASLVTSSDLLTEQIFNAYQEEMYESILQQLSKPQ
jgi:hypothetical protein